MEINVVMWISLETRRLPGVERIPILHPSWLAGIQDTKSASRIPGLCPLFLVDLQDTWSSSRMPGWHPGYLSAHICPPTLVPYGPLTRKNLFSLIDLRYERAGFNISSVTVRRWSRKLFLVHSINGCSGLFSELLVNVCLETKKMVNEVVKLQASFWTA